MDETIPYESIEPDQIEFIDWLEVRTEALGALPISFGKTVCALTAFARLKAIHPEWRMVVFSTVNIVNHTWPDEIEKWDHLDLKYQSLQGHLNSDRRLCQAMESDIVGVSFESMRKFFDKVDAELIDLPEVMLIDESSKMKDHKAKRVDRLIHPRWGYVHRFKRRWLLSATPAPEGYTGLWSQEACMGPRRRLGQNITTFRSRYCHMFGQAPSTHYVVHDEGEKAIEEKLSKVMYMPKLGDYLGLPEPSFVEVSVPWTDEAWAQYREMEDTAVLELERALQKEGDHDLADLEDEDEAMVVAPNAAAVCTKLRQLCSGFIYRDEGDGGRETLRSHDHAAKLAALGDVAERAGGSPLLVFTQYCAEKEDIASHFRGAQTELPSSLGDWDSGRIPMLVLDPRAAGHGLNLQHGSNVCVYYSLPYSYEQYIQSWGRLQRKGQKRQVSVVRITRPGSIDNDVWKKLNDKGAKLSDFLESMRERRARLAT